MNVANQLYQLQELDMELESNEQALRQVASQLGENEAVVGARNRLALEQERLDDLKKQQGSVEWDIDDLTSKLTAAEKELYGGKIHNPKELLNLQSEIDGLKARRGQLEEKALELMDQTEVAARTATTLNSELKSAESDWQSRQQQLSAKMEQLKTVLSNLNQKRELLAAEIEPRIIDAYDKLRKQKGIAIAKVEQGICCGCRISLPVAELQLARSGGLVRCGSCGRILFLA